MSEIDDLIPAKFQMEAQSGTGRITSQVIYRSTILFYLLFTIFTFNLPFFGDHVSIISTPANFILDNHFKTLILPTSIDTGHPPFVALLHAVCWSVFGRNLIVSHLISFFSITLLIAQFYRLGKKTLPAHALNIALLLIVFQPTILAQVATMSLDVLLCGLFIYGLNCILSGRRNGLRIAVIFLLLVSMRGIIASGFLFIADLIFAERKKISVKKFFDFVLASLPGIAWYLFHYSQTGWMFSHAESPWAAGRQPVSLKDFAGNIFEYGLRLIEYGMIVIWVILLLRFKKLFRDEKIRKWILLLIAGILFYALFLLPFRNPIMIRYLLPLQIICILIFAYFVSTLPIKRRNAVTGMLILLFTAHHFFAYPQMQSSLFEYNWGEGSLSHLSYFKFRKMGLKYVTDHKSEMKPEDIYTSFPDYKNFYDTDLLDERIQYQTIELEKISTYPYIIYSNIMNGIPKDVESELKSNWVRERTWYNYPVEYIIFKNPRNVN